MKRSNKRVEVKFDYAKWKNELELDRLNKILDECTYYPFNVELKGTIDWLILLDKKHILLVDDFKILQYRTGLLNQFYHNLFTSHNFDPLRYIDVGKALRDREYLKCSGKIVSQNFFREQPEYNSIRKSKDIIDRFASNEYQKLSSAINVLTQNQSIKNLESKKDELLSNLGSVNNELSVAHRLLKRNRAVRGKFTEFKYVKNDETFKRKFRSNVELCKRESGKINFSKLGRIYEIEPKTAKRWYNKFGKIDSFPI